MSDAVEQVLLAHNLLRSTNGWTKVTNLGTVKECPQVCAAGLKVCEGMDLLSSKLPELQGFAGHGNEGWSPVGGLSFFVEIDTLWCADIKLHTPTLKISQIDVKVIHAIMRAATQTTTGQSMVECSKQSCIFDKTSCLCIMLAKAETGLADKSHDHEPRCTDVHMCCTASWQSRECKHMLTRQNLLSWRVYISYVDFGVDKESTWSGWSL